MTRLCKKLAANGINLYNPLWIAIAAKGYCYVVVNTCLKANRVFHAVLVNSILKCRLRSLCCSPPEVWSQRLDIYSR